MKKIVFLTLFASVLTSCSHIQVELVSEETLKDLQAQVETALVNEVRNQPNFIKINEIQTSDLVQDKSDGIVSVHYRVSFDTDKTPPGRVTHSFDGMALLDRKSKDGWYFKKTESKNDELIFHDPLVVIPNSR